MKLLTHLGLACVFLRISVQVIQVEMVIHQPPATLEKSYLQLHPFLFDACIHQQKGLRYLTSTGWAHHPWSGISIVAYWLLHSSCEDCCLTTFGNVGQCLVGEIHPQHSQETTTKYSRDTSARNMAWCPNTSDHHWRKKRSRNEYLIRPSWRLESTLHCCSQLIQSVALILKLKLFTTTNLFDFLHHVLHPKTPSKFDKLLQNINNLGRSRDCRHNVMGFGWSVHRRH
jgi:hypothetical protein